MAVPYRCYLLTLFSRLGSDPARVFAPALILWFCHLAVTLYMWIPSPPIRLPGPSI